MDIKKIFAKIKRERAEFFKADISDNSNLSTPEINHISEVKLTDDKAHNNKVESPAKCHDEKPRKLEVPPNCYVDGKIQAHFGECTYQQIYKYTSRKLVIKDDGARRIPCYKCPTPQDFKNGKVSKDVKKLICGYCRGNFAYIDWANSKATTIRHALHRKGLVAFADGDLSLGFDDEKQALIFPLNKVQYVELPFNGREFTLSKADSLPILMHYNRAIKFDSKRGFVPIDIQNFRQMPYLDNRFYGVNGETIIAECAAFQDGGRKRQDEGKLILPFPI